jgi:hypothetical protein
MKDRLRKPNAVKKELHRQWKEVIQKNPLVAVSYFMQKIEFVSEVLQRLSPLSLDAVFKFESTEELIDAFPDTDSMSSIAVRFTNCLNKLDSDLEKAQTDKEIKAAFERFGRCWRGEE